MGGGPGRARPGRASLAIGTAAAVLVSGLGMPTAGAAPAHEQGVGPAARCAQPVLTGPARGGQAVRALAGNLAAVAARNGTTGAALAAHLRAERTLWVDPCGDLFFADEVPDLPASAADEVPAWPSAPPVSDALLLHSRPGAARVLFLDFDGHLVSGTAWNDSFGLEPWQAPAFSLDSDPTFSEVERARIIEVWQRVAQDYAPFEVDVTTEDPGLAALTRSSSGDTTFGMRVLISPDATQSQCGCGGRAYIDVFDRVSTSGAYQPAWVYPQALSNHPKYIADAASHEAGHTLGLRHDGTASSSYYGGAGGWGPIMGAPYSQALTQWSDGSYPSANNVEDDVALIAANGAPLVPDGVGNDGSDAAELPLGATTTGLVGTRTDVDAYRVQVGAGLLSATADPLWPGPNLDLSLTVATPDGVEVARSAPSFATADVRASVGAQVLVEVPAGTYLVSVTGTGNGIPGSAGADDYGSLGGFTLSVSGPAPTPTPTPSPTPTPTPSPTPTPTPSPTPTISRTPTPTPTPTLTPTPTSTPTPAPRTVTPTTAPPPSTSGGGATAAIAPLAITTRKLPRAKRRAPYRAQLSATGGVAPYTWKRTKRKLPKGLKVTKAGLVWGTPKRKASKKIRFRVTDARGVQVTRWVRIRVR